MEHISLHLYPKPTLPRILNSSLLTHLTSIMNKTSWRVRTVSQMTFFLVVSAILKDCNRVIHNDAHRGVKTLQYNQLTLFHRIALYSALYRPFFNRYLRPFI